MWKANTDLLYGKKTDGHAHSASNETPLASWARSPSMRVTSACASSASMAYRISVSSGTCSSVFSCVACKVRVTECRRIATRNGWLPPTHLSARYDRCDYVACR